MVSSETSVSSNWLILLELLIIMVAKVVSHLMLWSTLRLLVGWGLGSGLPGGWLIWRGGYVGTCLVGGSVLRASSVDGGLPSFGWYGLWVVVPSSRL